MRKTRENKKSRNQEKEHAVHLLVNPCEKQGKQEIKEIKKKEKKKKKIKNTQSISSLIHAKNKEKQENENVSVKTKRRDGALVLR